MRPEIYLDRNQMRLLKPLFDKSERAIVDERDGIVIGEVIQDGAARFDFIKHEYAEKIIEIVKRQEILFRRFNK